MDLKDAAITAAILNSTSNLTNANVAAEINTERLKGDTERIRNESRHRSAQTDIDILTSQNAYHRERQAQHQIDKISHKNLAMRERMRRMEAEMNEMRAMMKEWVSSQRGLLALAKELKKEIDTCPNKEHHVLKDGKLASEIAQNAAKESHSDAIPRENPVYSPSWQKRAGVI